MWVQAIAVVSGVWERSILVHDLLLNVACWPVASLHLYGRDHHKRNLDGGASSGIALFSLGSEAASRDASPIYCFAKFADKWPTSSRRSQRQSVMSA